MNKKSKRSYISWRGMKSRCKKNWPQSHLYYSKGIRVCKKWECYDNFIKDMGEPPTENHSIDRINNSKGYYKKNCRWATSREQACNTSKSKKYSYNGEKLTVSEIAEKINIPKPTLYNRLRAGVPIKLAATPEKQNAVYSRKTKAIKFNGMIKSQSEWAREYRLHSDTLGYRLKNGWSIKESLTTPADSKHTNIRRNSLKCQQQ